jgi:cyclopropane fatty-acyl-phospholipid synthase-like methyltransferase
MAKNKPKSNKSRGKAKLADQADRHELYEAAVQGVESEIDFVEKEFLALRGRRAHSLREDFCGTGNSSCEWVRRRVGNHAIGVDLDDSVLAWGQQHHVAGLKPAQRERIQLLHDDVMTVDTPPQDVVVAMNFSYWLFKTRDALRDYFKRAHAALIDDGVMFVDCYGGYDAFRELKEKTAHENFTYVWDQSSYNPVNGEMLCHIHFRFPDGSQMKNAFTYDWRLWTLPEIREILAEAGFSRSVVYWQGWDEDGETGSGEFDPVESADADAGWIAYVAALK